MDKEDYKKYYRILEIDTSASIDEIERAYLHLKELYSSDSMITFPVEDEFEENKKEEIIGQIEDAYEKLKSYMERKDKKEELVITIEKTPPTEDEKAQKGEAEEIKEEKIEEIKIEVDKNVKEEEVEEVPVEESEEVIEEEIDEVQEEKIEDVEEAAEEVKGEAVEEIKDEEIEEEQGEEIAVPVSYNGKKFKELRQKLKIKLDKVSDEIDIPQKVLKNIELEKFGSLPEGGYVRWYVMKYAEYLSIDPQNAANDYMKRYRDWEKKE